MTEDATRQWVFAVAKELWDKHESEYWDFESDCRPFVLGELIDDEPIADEWFNEVAEIMLIAERLRPR